MCSPTDVYNLLFHFSLARIPCLHLQVCYGVSHSILLSPIYLAGAETACVGVGIRQCVCWLVIHQDDENNCWAVPKEWLKNLSRPNSSYLLDATNAPHLHVAVQAAGAGPAWPWRCIFCKENVKKIPALICRFPLVVGREWRGEEKQPQFSGKCEELQIVEKKSGKHVRREVIVGGYRQEKKGRSRKQKFGQKDLVNQANFCVLSSLSL